MMTHSTTIVFFYQKHRPEYGRFIVGEVIVNKSTPQNINVHFVVVCTTFYKS
jgi:hypothetical protein